VKVALRLILLTAVLAVLVVALEAATRLLDGYRLFSRHLVSTRPVVAAAPAGAVVHKYVDALPVADGVRREWFDLSPDPLPRPPLTPELADVAARVTTAEIFKLWNTRMIQERVCSGDPFFEGFPGFAFSFVPSDDSIRPPFRYLRSVATPYGLVTNRFGFRGHEIAPDKPARVVRLAFVGASTTVGAHGQPFSYPELVEPWLNAWAAQVAPGIRFDVINAGREGIGSPDIAAIVRDELAPLEPDLIVYHEGANQFLPRDLVASTGESIVVPRSLDANRSVPGADTFDLMRRLDVFVQRFGFGPGTEPRKPRHRLVWPPAVDESHPDPDSADLPLHLPQIVHDLDDIRRSASAIDATVVVSSFIWMAKDGLVVDRANHRYYYDTMNLKYWPVTYAEMRRLADFQNRVFRAYAASRNIPFIDPSASYPLDITLFADPVHVSMDGDRLRAWVIFQGLVPILRAQVESGRLPAPDRAPLTVAPVPSPLPRTALQCTDFSHQVEVAGGLPLQGLHAESDSAATVTGAGVKHVVTAGARYAYAAETRFTDAARVPGAGVVRVRARVMSGSVSIGILNRDRSAFVVSRLIDAGHGAVEVYLPVPSLADAGALVISNALGRPGEQSVVDLEDIAVLVPRS
jgi:hypothetical protein